MNILSVTNFFEKDKNIKTKNVFVLKFKEKQ